MLLVNATSLDEILIILSTTKIACPPFIPNYFTLNRSCPKKISKVINIGNSDKSKQSLSIISAYITAAKMNDTV